MAAHRSTPTCSRPERPGRPCSQLSCRRSRSASFLRPPRGGSRIPRSKLAARSFAVAPPARQANVAVRSVRGKGFGSGGRTESPVTIWKVVPTSLATLVPAQGVPNERPHVREGRRPGGSTDDDLKRVFDRRKRRPRTSFMSTGPPFREHPHRGLREPADRGEHGRWHEKSTG